MPDREKVIKGIQECDLNGGLIGNCPYKDILFLLKEQEESIPVSWLKEKLDGHPELPYSVTDGIINVLDLWEGR